LARFSGPGSFVNIRYSLTPPRESPETFKARMLSETQEA
jgi:hypothetical protein